MQAEIFDRLVVGILEGIACDSSGSARDVIAHGYLAADNAFTALLKHLRQPASFNHKVKLEAAWENLVGTGNSDGLSKDQLVEFYAAWQEARYSPKEFAPNDAVKFRRLTWSFFYRVLFVIGSAENLTVEQLEDQLYERAWGNRWMKYHEHLSIVHDIWQQAAEEAADRGVGTRLGNKMENPSNDSDLTVVTADEHVRALLDSNYDVALHVGKIYDRFLQLISTIRKERHAAGMSPDEIMEFSLAVHVRYFGRPITEIAKDWAKALQNGIDMAAQRKRDDNGNP